MSLLDQFSVLFEADTGTLDKGLDKSEKGADDLVDKLKDVDSQANKAGGSFAGMASKALGALAAVMSVRALITDSMARANDIHLMNQTSQSIGVAVEEMDAFRRVIEDTGGTAQGAQSSMEKMAQAIGAAMTDVNSQQSKVFDRMGINLQDVNGNALNAADGILAVAGAIEDMSKEEARFTIRQLGIEDRATIELLLKGRAAIEDATRAHKEQGVVTAEMAERAGKLDDAMNKLRGGMDRASMGMMNLLLPAIIKGVEWLTKMVEWANENKTVVGGFFGAIAGIVMAIYLPAMISAAAATLAATWPIIAIAAIVVALAAAFALAYDDIMAFVAGNDSFIGQIFEKFPLVEKIVMGVINHFKLMGQAIAAVFTFILDAWKATFDGIMSGVSAVRSGIQSVASFFGIGGSDDVEAGQNAISAANASPLNSMTSNAISNSASQSNENNVQIGEVVVQTQATDAEGISRDIGSNLNDQLMQLDAEFSSGVAR